MVYHLIKNQSIQLQSIGFYLKEFFNYNLLPSQESIDIGIENGRYSCDLAETGQFPSQKSIDFAAVNGDAWSIYKLALYGQYPNQDAINIAVERGYTDVIAALNI